MFGVSYNQNQFGSTLEETIEHHTAFRFRITWAYLAAAPRKAEKNLTVHAPAPARAMTEPRAAPVSPASKAQWEMVIPKMVRPPTRPAPPAIAAHPVPPQVAAPPPRERAEEAPIRPLTLFAETEPEKARRVRLAKWGLVAVAILGVAVLVRPKAQESDPQPSISFAGGWSRRAISPPGRQIIAYDLSRDESN